MCLFYWNITLHLDDSQCIYHEKCIENDVFEGRQYFPKWVMHWDPTYSSFNCMFFNRVLKPVYPSFIHDVVCLILLLVIHVFIFCVKIRLIYLWCNTCTNEMKMISFVWNLDIFDHYEMFVREGKILILIVNRKFEIKIT